MTAVDTSNYDAVARRAYELFLSRGGEHGHDQEDWYRAEQEVAGAANSDVSRHAPAAPARERPAPAKTSRPKVAGKK
jgi:Protein of unknown function (DUF2934)